MIDLTQYVWLVWLIFIVVCIIIELLTLEFTFLMIAFGSIAGLGADLLGLPWWLQFLIAAGVSVLLILTIRPVLLRYMRKGEDPTPSNIAALLGMTGRVLSPVEANSGLVKLANGETWTARLSPTTEQRTVTPGETVLVTLVDGATVVIIPTERATP
ncbi:membrane protein [Agromyces rhizosphaerae]|uniref:Membrane protein n=1 Tax=Agromyces rhizosphaerae TaxID=88374 RepID=A0A9W6CTW2_9MICO|nr:NfeD family protein [Agromyces rhizosphaerae]GLI28931.1 membrane protein [Agromyces rhizosphaerae]